MMRTDPLRLALLLLLPVAACAPTTQGVRTTAPPPIVSPTASLSRVIGQTADVAINLLGSPSLDRSEGQARHLQFARTGCVLDLFYYPDARGGPPRATYADARTPDGARLDAGQCFDRLYRTQSLN